MEQFKRFWINLISISFLLNNKRSVDKTPEENIKTIVNIMQEKQIGEPSSISPKLLKNKRHKNNIKLKKLDI